MPTILRDQGFRFYFYSHEPNEPPHIHVDKDGASAKFWLQPVALARNMGLTSHDVMWALKKVRIESGRFLEAWHGHFGD
jgi:hypothetical protein